MHQKVSEQSNQGSFSLEGLKVMIVDDNAMNVEVLAVTLSSMGLHTFVFTDPIEAEAVSAREKFDLFAIDIMMPGLNGFELAQRIKDSKINSDIPIMFISALSEPENKIKGYEIGSQAYIEKPFNINVVRSQVLSILKQSAEHQAHLKEKETFLAMVTHDLKSPVSAEILALKQLMHIDEANARKELIIDILGAANYTKNLVDNVLGKYKLDTGTLTLHKTNFCMKALVEECVEEIKYIFDGKTFDCKLKDVRVNADYLEIKRVVNNLLLNAGEHAIRGTEIEIRLKKIRGGVGFSVKNYCDGICANVPDEIFEKDFSAQKRTGTGLGLYISRQIIEAHGGQISAESKSGKWVRISFTLPL